MDYEQFAADLPLDRTIKAYSAEENREIMDRAGVEQRVRQLGKGSFRSDLAVLETEQVSLIADRFSKACSIYAEPPKGYVGLLVGRSANEQFLASGTSVANDKMVFVPKGTGTDLVISDLSGSECIVIPESRFFELTEAISPTSRPPTEVATIEGNTAQLHVLRQAIVAKLNLPESQVGNERLSNLVAQMVIWMCDSCEGSPEVLTDMKTRVGVAKMAQEFIESNYREAIRTEDLCRVTGVGARALRRSFREYFDLTINDYIKAVRLHAAHCSLSSAVSAETSVTTIALEQGFTHLGRFSVQYRQRFGESPSLTLSH